jgi:DNA-binding response OmpR family regulator
MLEGENFEVVLCTTIKDAKDNANTSFEIAILDWMLPDGQGIDLLKDLRGSGFDIPVIMLTARSELIDKVIGLESGANDYMTKPFESRELLARIRAQLRASKPTTEEKNSNEIIVGNIIIDLEKRTVKKETVLIEFTKMEFDLLVLLASYPGRAFSREEILNKVWGYDNFPSTRTVDTHVLQLRNKLYDYLIETVRGIGYKLIVDQP